MKKLFVICFILISASCYSQAKDTTKKDSVKTYAIILTDKEYENLIVLIRSADEKPSVIEKYIAFLNSRTQLIPKK